MGRLFMVVAVLAPGGAAGAADGDRSRGRTLGEVLQAFRERGVALIYSSAMVDEAAPVAVEPPATVEPRVALDAVLRQFGLRTEPGPGRSLLILRGVRDPETIGAATGPPRVGGPLGFREDVSVVPGRRAIEDVETRVSRALERADALLVPAIGGDLGRVVEKLPGVVTSDHSAAWHVRGSLAGDTSVVLDGLELYDPYHLSAFQSPFTLIDPRVVERIAILPGGFTAEYGDRHGAFIEIDTTGSVDRAGGEVEIGTLNSRVAYRAPTDDGAGAWLVSFRAWYPEAFIDSIGLGGGERLRPRLGDLYAKLTRVASARSVWSVHGLLSYDRVSFRESATDDSEVVEAIARHANVWGRAVTVWSETLRGEAVLSAGIVERDRNGVASPEDQMFTVRDDRSLSYLGWSQDLVWAPSSRGRLKAGATLRRLDAAYDYDLRTTGAGSPDRAVRLEPAGWQFGVYASHRHRLARTLVGEFGMRWDRQEVIGETQFAPRAHLVWSPTERTEMRLAAGRFEQSQRVHELSVADGETTFAPSETSEQLEGVISHRLAGGNAIRLDLCTRDLDRLRTRYENLFSVVELFPEAADDRVAISPDGARLRGLEFTVQGPPDGDIRWWTAYALASAEDEIDGRDVPRSLDQRHTVKFLFAWRGSPRWNVALSGTAHTGRPFTSVSATEVQDPGGSTSIEVVVGDRNGVRLPHYRRLDFKVQYLAPVRSGSFALTLDVLNVTDRDNACCIADFFFEPTGGGEVAVRTEFESWLGIVPTFSARWEF